VGCLGSSWLDVFGEVSMISRVRKRRWFRCFRLILHSCFKNENRLLMRSSLCLCSCNHGLKPRSVRDCTQ